MDVRKCRNCGQEKPADDFYRRGDGRQARCKDCVREHRRENYLPPTRQCVRCGREYVHRGKAGVRRKTCPTCAAVGRVCPRCGEFKTHDHFYARGRSPYCRDGCASAKNRESRYGLTADEYDVLLAVQECQVCGSVSGLNIDHDHTTGKVRGWLCTNCNHGIGKFRDDPALLRAAAAYIEHHA